MKMGINRALTMFGHASWVITLPIGCSQLYRNFWPPLSAKQIAIPSLPHLGIERQQSVKEFWSCVLGNHPTERLQSVTEEFLATFIGKTDYDTLPA